MSNLLPIYNKTAFNPRMDSLADFFAPPSVNNESSKSIGDYWANMQLHKSPSVTIASPPKPMPEKPIEEQLFDSRAGAKILIAQVAMHLDQAVRDKIFRQLDALLDIGEWDTKDKLLDHASYATFLRLILYQRPSRLPGLGLSYGGNVISAWTNNENRLTIECLPRDEIRWVLSHTINGERETAAGRTPLYRLPEVLVPYNAQQWFVNGHNLSTT